MTTPITGSWLRSQQPQPGADGYIPAGQNLGYGYNPIHEKRDNSGRPNKSREQLISTGPAPSGFVPEAYITNEWYGFFDDYDNSSPDYRENAVGITPPGTPYPRGDSGQVEKSSKHNGPVPFGPGTTYGPYQGSLGGFSGKNNAQEIEESVPAHDKQLLIGTSMVQISKKHGQSETGRKTADDPRSTITPVLTGPRERVYAKDFEQGGGAGTPRMRPVSHDRIPKRPWVSRHAAIPGILNSKSYNTMSSFTPVSSEPAEDPGSTVDNAYGGEYLGD